MDWLIRETEPGGPQLFSTWALPILPGAFGVVTIPSTAFKSPTGRNKYGLASPCGCRVYIVSTHLPCRHAHRPGRLLPLP